MRLVARNLGDDRLNGANGADELDGGRTGTIALQDTAEIG